MLLHMFRTKTIRPETKLLDEEGGRVSAVVSTEKTDRDGDIIRMAGWDLTAFHKNPLLLSSHDYRSLRSVIGEWESMEVKGKRLVGVAHYFIGEGNDEADWGFNLAKRRRAAFSVGFIPDMEKARPIDEDATGWLRPMEFNGQELLEVSHVAIPSNPDALQRMKGANLDPAIAEVVDEILTDHVMVEANADEQPGIDIRLDRIEGLIERLAEEVAQAAARGAIKEPPELRAADDLGVFIRRAVHEGVAQGVEEYAQW